MRLQPGLAAVASACLAMCFSTGVEAREIITVRAGVELLAGECVPLELVPQRQNCPMTAHGRFVADVRPVGPLLVSLGLGVGGTHHNDSPAVNSLIGQSRAGAEPFPLNFPHLDLKIGLGAALPVGENEIRLKGSLVFIKSGWAAETLSRMDEVGVWATSTSTDNLGFEFAFAADFDVGGVLRMGPRFALTIGNAVAWRWDEELEDDEQYQDLSRLRDSNLNIRVQPQFALSVPTELPVGFWMVLGPEIYGSTYTPAARERGEQEDPQWYYAGGYEDGEPEGGFRAVFGVEIRLGGG